MSTFQPGDEVTVVDYLDMAATHPTVGKFMALVGTVVKGPSLEWGEDKPVYQVNFGLVDLIWCPVWFLELTAKPDVVVQ